MSAALRINEIYLSLQGESAWAGFPCVFVRFTACPLRCSYCDTAYAFSEGDRLKLEEVLERVDRLAAPFQSRAKAIRLPLVELTGGEPLAQAGAFPLMRRLADAGYTTLLETSGALAIASVDPRVHRIMDLKCPSSGESGRNLISNLAALTERDEIKFVIASHEDYEWSREMIERHGLAGVCSVACSWAAPLTASQRDASLKPFPKDHRPISRQELADRILADALPVRFQIQMHKVIWPPDARGV